MRVKHIWRGVGLTFLGLLVSVPSLAGAPTDQIRDTTDKIVAVVSNPAYRAPGRAQERRRLIREAVDERFDWEEMSRRSLARHWSRRTTQEKKEFIELFGKLLERTYLEKVEGYSGEKVRYVDEQIDPDDPTYAVVKVKIVTQHDTEIPVGYRLKKKGAGWYVYDISIEGVSLINNYRKQFRGMSYPTLIRKLKEKVSEKG
jgi:phospholipid transport system substrate-binding protein